MWIFYKWTVWPASRLRINITSIPKAPLCRLWSPPLQGNHYPDLRTWEMRKVLFGVCLCVGFSALIWAVVMNSCLLHYGSLLHDSLCILWLMDIWIVSSLEALQIVLLWTFSYVLLLSTRTRFCWVYTYAGHRMCISSSLGDTGRNTNTWYFLSFSLQWKDAGIVLWFNLHFPDDELSIFSYVYWPFG